MTPSSTDATIDSYMRDDEVCRRLPEVDQISDDEIREATVDAIGRGMPDYFWEVPATSSSRYHNPFARMKHGLWIHTKMVFTSFERLVESKVKRGIFSEREADAGRAACLLHDMLKYGHAYQSGDSCKSNHDNLAGHWLTVNSELPETTVKAVKRHNGFWYDGPEPDYKHEPVCELVHVSDMIAATSDISPGVYKPAEEIVKRYPGLPRAQL